MKKEIGEGHITKRKLEFLNDSDSTPNEYGFTPIVR